MTIETKAIILHIYNWTRDQQQSAHDASVEIVGKTQRKLMLEAKRKAYGNVADHIKCKYGKVVDFNYIVPQ